MNHQSDILNSFSKYLFWDVDINSIDLNKHAGFIINRLVTKGSYSDWKALKKIYGLQKIRAEVVKARSLNKKTLWFLSAYFEILKKEFRCYNYNR